MFRQKLLKGPDSSPSNSHFQSTSLSSVLNTNETTLQQTCLQRIKQQRLKIQDLVSLAQQQQRQLQEKQETIFELQQRIEAIEADCSFKEGYEQLKSEFEDLTEKHRLEQQQHKQKERLLGEQLINSSRALEEAKTSQKHLKEQIDLLEVHWRGIADDKDETLALVEREHEMKEQILRKKLAALTQKHSAVKESHLAKESAFREAERELRSKSKIKEKELQKAKKVIELSQNECSHFRLRVSEKENELQIQRESMKEDLQSLNLIVSSLRREVTQKMMQVESLRESLRKVEARNRQLEDAIGDARYQEKNTRTKRCLSEQQLHREKHSRLRLEDEVSRIKRQNSRHVSDYNVLQIELHKWKDVAEKRSQGSKMRKIISNSAFH